MSSLLDRFYPEREITTTSKDPRFVTPTVKAMLRRKNRLMRAGRTEEADAASRRVGGAITRQNKAWRQDAHDAWEKVRAVTGASAERTNDAVEGITTQVLNLPTTYDRILVTCSSAKSRDHIPDEVRRLQTKPYVAI